MDILIDVFDFIIKLLNMFGIWPPLILSILLIFAFGFKHKFSYEYKVLGNPQNPAYKDRVDQLNNSGGKRKLFFGFLEYVFIHADKYYGPLEELKAKPNPISAFFGIEPFTSNAFGRSIIIAINYSVYFLLLTWSLGKPTQLAGLDILQANTRGGQPFTLPLKIIISTWISLFPLLVQLLFVKRIHNYKNIGYYLIAFVMLIGYFMVEIANIIPQNILIIASALFLAAIVYQLSDKVFKLSGKAKTSDILTALGLLAGSTVTTMLISYINITYTWVLSTIIITLALGLYYLHYWLSNLDKLHLFWRFLWPLLVLTFMLVVFWFGHNMPQNQNAIVLVLFLAIIPLFNAPLDWLSLGITRGLLYKIQNKKNLSKIVALGLILVDLIFAVITLVLVAASCYVGFWLVNLALGWSGSAIHLDMGQLYGKIKPHSRNLWISLMMSTTLVPSLINLAILATSIMASLFWYFSEDGLKGLASELQKAIEKGGPEEVHEDARQRAAQYFTAKKYVLPVFIFVLFSVLFFLVILGIIWLWSIF